LRVGREKNGLVARAGCKGRGAVKVYLLCVVAGLSFLFFPKQGKAEKVSPRIITVSPALTSIALKCGLADNIVGVSRWATLPAGMTRPVVGDSLRLDAERVISLNPDFVFTQTSSQTGLPGSIRVEQFSIETLEDIRAAVLRMGKLTGHEREAQETANRFSATLERVAKDAANHPSVRVLFITGTSRPLAAGPKTFVGEMIELTGATNAARQLPGKTRWLMTEFEAILAARPDVLICHAVTDREAREANAYWQKWMRKTGHPCRVYSLSDPAWTIPTPSLAEKTITLNTLIYGQNETP